MLDLLGRALLSPIDYHHYLYRHKLSFKERINEGNGVFSFIFETDHSFTWLAGQHGVFRLPNESITGKSWRAFSVASSSYENVVKISTNILPKPSDFKAKLQNLNVGDLATINGPYGEFHTKQNDGQLIGIAGGIGITPFRAILYEIANNHLSGTSLELIYAGKNDYFTYKDELDRFADHPAIKIHYVNTPEEVNQQIDILTNHYKNTAKYFISGSPGMITAVKNTLKSKGIKRIINDPFKGY
ncbi:FAD-dependent oxidoreductase [Candidatus Kaiserbacteria bacterium]|nr:FAD-dependent oxidoreductase [Candidatus Kaiserbacteria bacterium]